MFTLILTFLGLAAVVVIAAVFLASSADNIAEGTGLGRSMVGLILLAGGTSLPELLVGWTGVRIGAYDLTIGELLGSCLLNLMILAIMDLITHARGTMLSRAALAHALSASTCILLAAIVLISLLMPFKFGILRLSLGSWAIAFVYLGCMRLIYNDQRIQIAESEPEEERGHPPLFKAIAIYLLAASAIVFAAPRLAVVAHDLSEKTGLGETFFGTVFVALITSLPEVVSTYTAIRIGAFDMAVGNILGSNCINIFIISLVDFASETPILAAASLTHALTATSTIIVTTVAITAVLYRPKRKYLLLDPDAWMIISLVLGALYLVYASPSGGAAH